MNPSGKVQFVYVVGDVLPAEVDDSTIYVVGTTKKAIYVGSNFIVSDLISDFETLRTYIENYLGSENFIADIKTALQQMVDAGAFDELIAPMVQQALPGVVADQIDESVASQISTPVSDWLADHVDPSSQYVIDDTMSIHGAAADAKATGDAIADIVKVSETAPSSDFNRIWIVDDEVGEVEVPTMDEFTTLKSALTKFEVIPIFTESDGYTNSDGTIHAQTTALEVYTDPIECEYLDNIIITVKTPTSENLWIAYLLYDENHNPYGGRVDLSDTGTELTQIVSVPKYAKYIVFSYKTYGYSNIATIEKYFGQANLRTIANSVDTLYNNVVAYNVGWHDGYLQDNGSVSPAGASTLEQYSDPIYLNGGDRVRILVDYPSKVNRWMAVNYYDINGRSTREVVIPSGGGNQKAIDYTYTAPNGTKYIAISYRTFGTSKIKILPLYIGDLTSQALNGIYNLAYVKDMKTNVNLAVSPFRNKFVYDHLFVLRSGNNITIPHESIYHVRFSRLLGFNMIEANIHKTSDNVYIVNHLDDGAFGGYFHHVDGVTDISETLVSDVTWDWIVQNVRYNSSIPKYRTRPCRLEEFLRECKQQGIIPFLGASNDSNVIAIADKYMGKSNYIAYGGNRTTTPNAIIFLWRSYSTKADILDACKAVGTPCIYGMANPESFTNEELADIVTELHNNGFWISTAYYDQYFYKYMALGFDLVGGIRQMNRIENGNVCNYDTMYGFSNFTSTNATENNGVLTYSADGTLSPIVSLSDVGNYAMDIEVSFVGTITIPSKGEFYVSQSYTSDGSIPVFVSFPIIHQNPQISLTVANGTVINDVKFKLSKV